MKPTNETESSPNKDIGKGSTNSGGDAYRRRWLPIDDRGGNENNSKSEHGRRDPYEHPRGRSRSQSPPKGPRAHAFRHDSANHLPESRERSRERRMERDKRTSTCWFWATEGQNCLKSADDCAFLHLWTDRVAPRPAHWGQKGAGAVFDSASLPFEDQDQSARRALPPSQTQSLRSLEESLASLLIQFGEDISAIASIGTQKEIAKASRNSQIAMYEKNIQPSIKDEVWQGYEASKDQLSIREDDIKKSTALTAKKLAALLKSVGRWTNNDSEKVEVKPLVLEIKALQKSNFDKSREIAELRDQMQSSAAAVKQSTTVNMEFNNALQKLGPSIKNIEERVELLQTSNSEKTKEMAELKVQNLNLSWTVKDLSKTKLEISNELQEIRDRSEKSSLLHHETSQEMKREIQELRVRSERFSNQPEIREMRSEIQELRARLKDLHRQHETVRETRVEVTGLKNSCSEKSSHQNKSLQELRSEIKDIKDRFDSSLHNQHKATQDIKTQIKAQFQELTERLQESSRRHDPSREILVQTQELQNGLEDLSHQQNSMEETKAKVQGLVDQVQALSNHHYESLLALDARFQNLNEKSETAPQHELVEREQAQLQQLGDKLEKVSYQHQESLQELHNHVHDLRDRLETTNQQHEALRLEIQGDGNSGRKGLVDQVYDLQDGLLSYFQLSKANEQRLGNDLVSLKGKIEHANAMISGITPRPFVPNTDIISARPEPDYSTNFAAKPSSDFVGDHNGSETRMSRALQRLSERCEALESSLTSLKSEYGPQISHLFSELLQLKSLSAANGKITNEHITHLHDAVANNRREALQQPQQQHDLALHREHMQASIEAVQQRLMEEVQAVHLGIRTLETCYQNLRTDQMAHHILSQLDAVYPKLRNLDSTIADLCNARQRYVHDQSRFEQRLQALERNFQSIPYTSAPEVSPLTETSNGRKRTYEAFITPSSRENGTPLVAEVSNAAYREEGDRMPPRGYEGSNI